MNENMPARDEIVAMAVAVIAQELGTDIKHVRVRSFRQLRKTGLAQYLEDNQIQYTKYKLGI